MLGLKLIHVSKSDNVCSFWVQIVTRVLRLYSRGMYLWYRVVLDIVVMELVWYEYINLVAIIGSVGLVAYL